VEGDICADLHSRHRGEVQSEVRSDVAHLLRPSDGYGRVTTGGSCSIRVEAGKDVTVTVARRPVARPIPHSRGGLAAVALPCEVAGTSTRPGVLRRWLGLTGATAAR
jgi:hypothetical protein